MRSPFRNPFRRSTPPAYIETRLERLASYPPMPPPPVAKSSTGSAIRLVLADGSESALPDDPDLAARADYFVKSMLSPRPPEPDDDAP